VGGIETFTQTMARGVVQPGHQVTVIGFSESVKCVVLESDYGVEVVRIPRLPRTIVPQMFMERLTLERILRRKLKENHVDLVETHDVRGPLVIGNFGIPLVVRMHGASFVHFPNTGRRPPRFQPFFEKRTLHMATHLVAVSKYIRRETLSKGGLEDRTCALIYNGIDTELFKSSVERRVQGRILFVGRLSQTKGAPNLFRALPLVFEKNPSAKLRFVGKNPLGSSGKPASFELINLLPEIYRDRIEILGEKPRESLVSEYQSANLAVFPSLVEAHPVSVLEAMSCAAPTVFMASGPGPEVISHGEDGFLCDTTSPHAIADAILFMLDNNKMADEMGKLARLHIERQFSLPMFIDNNEAFYKSCLS
jgi:glycosyltransferase involved in cell wall biosynthesis